MRFSRSGFRRSFCDISNLLPLLGAAADRNSILPVQVLESGAFQSLGTVVSVVSGGSDGAPVARARLIYQNGTEAQCRHQAREPGGAAVAARDRRPGSPSSRGSGQMSASAQDAAGAVTVSGGTIGVVFDGRGRPLELPRDAGRRRELLQRWLSSIGG